VNYEYVWASIYGLRRRRDRRNRSAAFAAGFLRKKSIKDPQCFSTPEPSRSGVGRCWSSFFLHGDDCCGWFKLKRSTAASHTDASNGLSILARHLGVPRWIISLDNQTTLANQGGDPSIGLGSPAPHPQPLPTRRRGGALLVGVGAGWGRCGTPSPSWGGLGWGASGMGCDG